MQQLGLSLFTKTRLQSATGSPSTHNDACQANVAYVIRCNNGGHCWQHDPTFTPIIVVVVVEIILKSVELFTYSHFLFIYLSVITNNKKNKNDEPLQQ